MKANELMISDWVECTYWNPSKQLKVAEIRRIMDDEIKIGVYCDDLVLIFRQSEVKPIPLTPDILEKNGIKYQWGMPWYQGGFDGVFELHYNNSQDIAFGDTPTEIQIPISYVHQLQHTLRLCGIDPKITL